MAQFRGGKVVKKGRKITSCFRPFRISCGKINYLNGRGYSPAPVPLQKIPPKYFFIHLVAPWPMLNLSRSTSGQCAVSHPYKDKNGVDLSHFSSLTAILLYLKKRFFLNLVVQKPTALIPGGSSAQPQLDCPSRLDCWLATHFLCTESERRLFGCHPISRHIKHCIST